MIEWRMMSDFSIDLKDRPGILASLSAQLREARIGLLGLWGFGGADGSARIYCVPEQPDRFRAFAEEREMPVMEGTTFFITGDDAHGVLADHLHRLAEAGINVRAIEAVSVNAQFGAFIWADATDWPRLAAVLDGLVSDADDGAASQPDASTSE